VGAYFELEAQNRAWNRFTSPFHRTPRPSGVSLESPGLENIPQVAGNRSKVGHKHAAHKAILCTFTVLKWSGAIFRLRSSKPRKRSFYLCPFQRRPKPLGGSLESLGLQNIPQTPRNRPKIDQNNAARKAVLPIFSVLKWNGAIFRPKSSKASVRSFYLCQFYPEPRPSIVTLESQGVKNVLQIAGNCPNPCHNDVARKAVSATFSVLKWSGTIFRPRTSKPSVRSFYLCLIHRKAKPLRVSLKSPRLENISKVARDRPKVVQNLAARKAVWANLSVLKWSGAIFRPRRSRSFFLCQFHWKPKPSGVSLESPGLKIILQVPGNPAKVGQNHDARKAVSANFSVLK